MANNLPDLVELRVTVTDTGAAYAARFELAEYGTYPPVPRVTDGDLAFDPGTVVARAQVDVSRAAFAGLVQPPPAGVGAAYWGPLMSAAASALFGGPGSAILAAFLGRGTGTTQRRLALELVPALRAAPWELLPVPGGADPLSRRCAIVRRMAPAIRPSAVPMALPLEVGFTSLVTPGSEQTWADAFFSDPWSQTAKNLGALSWTAAAGPGQPLLVRHVLFDARDARQAAGMARPPAPLRSWKPTGPRLVVLQEVSGALHWQDFDALLQTRLNAGSYAVLLVSGDGPAADPGGFLARFYRKLTHNLPLDQALFEAVQYVRDRGRPEPRWALAARPDGELQLLLSAAVALASVPQAAQGAPSQGIPKGLPITRGAAKLPSRAERVAAEVRPAVRATQEQAQKSAAELVAAVATRSIAKEEMDLQDLMDARKQVAATGQAAQELQALAGRPDEDVAKSAMRLTNLWVTRAGDKAAAGAAAEVEALSIDVPYVVHLQIGMLRAKVLAAAVFPEEALREAFKTQETVRLDVAFFAQDSDFRLSAGRGALDLPRFGDSNEVTVTATPLRAGTLRLRACIYYRNTLLQSAFIEAEVGDGGPAAAGAAAGAAAPAALVARMVDYVASPDVALLDELPAPSINIFTNDGPNGSHWVGMFSSEAQADQDAAASLLQSFTPDELARIGDRMREKLAKIQGANWSDQPPQNDDQWRLREQTLVDAASEGYTAFTSLFLFRDDAPQRIAEIKKFRRALADPGIISVARCVSGSPTLPWAAIYDFKLDKGSPLHLCPVYKQQVQAGSLADYKTCSASDGCPLKATDGSEQQVVCPWGFWGFRHQIEQPAQSVTATPVGSVPPELQSSGTAQTAFVGRAPTGPVKMVMAASGDPGLGSDAHKQELDKLAASGQVTLDFTKDRQQVLNLLKQGGYHLYYFYCHGIRDVAKDSFYLQVGDPPQFAPIYAENIDSFDWCDFWENKPHALVMLNGCETVALTADVINKLVTALRVLGVSGVVGTEIKVNNLVARKFALRMLECWLAGKSLGEAILEARRAILAGGNAVGLIYSAFAPANLHLHPEQGCQWLGHVH